MKIKMLVCTAIWSAASTISYAIPGYPPKSTTAKASTVISAFVEASIHNDAVLFNTILDPNVEVKLNRQRDIITESKAEMVGFSKKTGPMLLNCDADFEVLSATECVVMARVDFKFPEFVQRNYVTIGKNKKGVWRITQIDRFHN